MSSYPHYPERKSLVLDGSWNFTLITDPKQTLKKFNPAKVVYDDISAVPGVFDSSLESFNVRGLGVYRKVVTGFPGGRSRLTIGGMGLYGRIFWDGKELGSYLYPYAEISYDFEADSAEEHELVIAVDNRFDAADFQMFRPNYDFYAFGGIYRSVTLQHLPEFSIERAEVFTKSIKTGTVKVRLTFSGKLPKNVEFSLAFDQCDGDIRQAKLSKGAVELEAKVPNFKVWSPESPNLHLLTVCTETDRIVERFGIRTIETKGEKILLNGKVLYLCGVNRHESHPELGPVQNTHLMLEDLRLARKLGANFIRAVHYQQNPEFFDLCDELGFLAWEETLGWGINDPETINVKNTDHFSAQNLLMVKRNINNPSIIFWAFLNECGSHLEGAEPFYRKLIDDIHAYDPSRLVSYACNHAEQDRCIQFCDVMSINTYPGWIWPETQELASATLEPDFTNIAKWCSEGPRKGKPVIFSETGCCGIYGWHDPAMAQWTEEFQSDYMMTSCNAIFRNPRFSGVTLWQFFDTKSYQRGGIRSKPRGVNFAGLLDEYRRPKLAYGAVMECFHKKLKK